MPNYEIRTTNYQNARKYLSSEVGEIGIGSDSCYRLVPEFEMLRELHHRTDKKVKLILPFVSQQYLAKAKALLDKVNEERLSITIVVNDFGILSYLSKIKDRAFELHIGRFMDWNYDLVPWSKNILRNEEYPDCFEQSSHIHDNKLKQYKNMRVSGIEAGYTKNINALGEYLLKNEIKLYVHYKYNVVALSRACPNRRLEQGERCSEHCSRYQAFWFDRKWKPNNSFVSGQTEYFKDEQLDKVFPKMYLKNNIVLRESEACLDNLNTDFLTGIIVDDAILEKADPVADFIKGA